MFSSRQSLVFITAYVLLPGFSAVPAQSTGRGGVDSLPLQGLWGFEQQRGPRVRGALVLTRAGSVWQLELAGYDVRATQQGDSVQLALPGGHGTLRIAVRASARGASEATPHAMWVQPPGLSSAYASPVQLTAAGANRWRGVVTPLDERFSLYLSLRPGADGGIVGRFRNPEGNFGNGRVFTVVREPGQIALVDPATGRRRFTQPFDSAAQTITFDFGGAVTATRRSLEDAVGFVPRTPGSAEYMYRTPADLGDGWTIGAATTMGLSADTLAALVRRVIATDPVDDSAPRLHAIVVARHGRLVLDEYFHGYDASRPHDLRSASKTMTSIMAGVVMRRGAALSPATRVTPAGATVGDLLTHTSGLACNDEDSQSPGNEDTMQEQSAQVDWYRYALALPQLHPPGTRYAYCSAGINLVGHAIVKADGRWLPRLFDEELAQPLGIRHYGINLMPTGEGYSGGGMHLRPRDLLKFGQLYLDGGSWRGRRLVSQRWVEESTRRQQPDTSGADDGYAWHRHVLRVRGRDIPSYEAGGNGGQFLVVVPSLDLVAVVTAGMYGQWRIWWKIRQELVARYIAGAVER